MNKIIMFTTDDSVRGGPDIEIKRTGDIFKTPVQKPVRIQSFKALKAAIEKNKAKEKLEKEKIKEEK